MSEHEHQAALFRWAGLACAALPELRLMYAIPNGGHRHIAVAAKLKAEGVKPGVPDICLPVPRHNFAGLYIELKAGKGRASDAQKWWLASLADQGYYTTVCHGWEAAKDVLCGYLGDGIVINREACH